MHAVWVEKVIPARVEPVERDLIPPIETSVR
jgi:hypothetical protein